MNAPICMEDRIVATYGQILQERDNQIFAFERETAELQRRWSSSGKPLTQQQMQYLQERMRLAQQMREMRSELLRAINYWLEQKRKDAEKVLKT